MLCQKLLFCFFLILSLFQSLLKSADSFFQCLHIAIYILKGLDDVFLTESAFLSLLGALIGLAVGLGGNWVLQQYFPDFPFVAPDWALWAAIVVALLTGIIFGITPARHAAELNAVDALAGR